MTLLLKATLAPLLVILASLAGRRWGDRLGGFVAGFPIVAGPILYFFALEQGPAFAAEAASACLTGLVSLSAFCVFYARARSHWWANLLTGWAAFALATYMLREPVLEWWLAWLIAALALLAGAYAMPAQDKAPQGLQMGRFDLPLRALSAAALVLALTGLAKGLGPTMSGLLTPFPVASSVLAVFAQRQGGQAASTAILKGMLLALQAFAVFCALLALLLNKITVFGAFFLALLACAVVQLGLLSILRRSA